MCKRGRGVLSGCPTVATFLAPPLIIIVISPSPHTFHSHLHNIGCFFSFSIHIFCTHKQECRICVSVSALLPGTEELRMFTGLAIS